MLNQRQLKCNDSLLESPIICSTKLVVGRAVGGFVTGWVSSVSIGLQVSDRTVGSVATRSAGSVVDCCF